ncbi:MAG: Gfo/Idh/MocA family oxidoreductase [Kiritimatiellae bacterium]|nr:Gfo/Idh/MocA family oxidoreductase [Kiritimatiellia bacterium]
MAKDLKVGIVGMGAIGSLHANAFEQAGNKAAALCDQDAKIVAQKSKQHNVDVTFNDWKELLADDSIDAVVVAVPNRFHKEIAVAALKAGKHVLLEKPMAMNADEAREIVAAEKASGKTLQIGMCQRQRPASEKLKQFIDDGMLGDIYHMRVFYIRRRGIPGLGGWFTTKAVSGGGPLIDLGVHIFDLCMWISSHWNPTRAATMTYAKFGTRMKDYRFVSMWAGPPRLDGTFDVEDYAAGFVRFGDKATMSFEVSWAANIPESQYSEFLGEKGGARLSSNEPLVIHTEHAGHVADIAPKFDDKGNVYARQAQKFLAAARGEGEPAATGEQGVIAMRLIDAIYRSAEQNAEVDVA